MGTYVEGRLEVELSRTLSEAEHAAWLERVRAYTDRRGDGWQLDGRRERGQTGRRLAERDRRVSDVPEVEDERRTFNGGLDRRMDPDRRVTQYRRRAYSYPGEWFTPDSWNVNADDPSWGDIGTLELAVNGFTIECGGKVYDVEDAARVVTMLLPEGVTADGEGSFTSDSEPWGLRVSGREAKACEVRIVVEPWTGWGDVVTIAEQLP